MKKSVKKVSKKDCYWCASLLDVAATKLAVFFGTLFLVTIFPKIVSPDWKWAFLAIALLLAIKPMRSFFRK